MVEPAACRPGTSFSRSTASSIRTTCRSSRRSSKRVGEVGLKGLAAEERQALLALPFKLIAARHRLGLIDESFEARVLEARRHFAANLPENLRDAVEFFDPERYNGAATLQDIVLFGKIVTGQAGANERITRLVREVLEELDLRLMVVKNGLDYQAWAARASPCPTGRRSRWCALFSSAR